MDVRQPDIAHHTACADVTEQADIVRRHLPDVEIADLVAQPVECASEAVAAVQEGAVAVRSQRKEAEGAVPGLRRTGLDAVRQRVAAGQPRRIDVLQVVDRADQGVALSVDRQRLAALSGGEDGAGAKRIGNRAAAAALVAVERKPAAARDRDVRVDGDAVIGAQRQQ